MGDHAVRVRGQVAPPKLNQIDGAQWHRVFALVEKAVQSAEAITEAFNANGDLQRVEPAPAPNLFEVASVL
jgi:hypothetical protein